MARVSAGTRRRWVRKHWAHGERAVLLLLLLVLLTSMLCKLGVGQDLFAELEPVSVLLVLVTSLWSRRERGEEEMSVRFTCRVDADGHRT